MRKLLCFAALLLLVTTAHAGSGSIDIGAQNMTQATDGTAAAPGIGFVGEAGMGFYRAGTGSLGLAVGGVSQGLFDTVGTWQLVATGTLKWSTTRAIVSSPANGVLQITNAAGGGTVGTSRLILGANASTGGASMVINNTAQRLGFMNGDASAYTQVLANSYQYSGASPNGLTDVSGNNGISWSAGTVTISGGGGSPVNFTTYDATGNATFTQTIKVQSAGVIRSGSAATPNAAVTGSPGDLYLSTSGGAGATLWVKETGAATNTGWVAK